MRALVLATAAVAVTAALAGCGITDPTATSTDIREPASPRESAVQHVNRTGEKPTARTVAHPPADVSPTPQLAVRRFAELYVNWTYRTLAAHQHRLAAMSVGPARAAQLRAAAHTPADTELRQGRIRNTGTIATIGLRADTPAGSFVVVTHETTDGNSEYVGLKAAYHVTLARVQHVRGGWAVSDWQPQT